MIYTYGVARYQLPDFLNSGVGGWRECPLFPGNKHPSVLYMWAFVFKAHLHGMYHHKISVHIFAGSSFKKNGGGCREPVHGTTHLEHLKKAFETTVDGKQLRRVLDAARGGHKYKHALRNTVATGLRRDGCTNEQVAGILWDVPTTSIMDMAYQRHGVPAAAVTCAGFKPTEQYTAVLHHLDMPMPPDVVEACRHVFNPMKPFETLEAVQARHRDPSFPAHKIDYSLENALQVLCAMAELVVRSLGAGIMRSFPDSNVWKHLWQNFPDAKVVESYIAECESVHLSPEACAARDEASHCRENAPFRMMVKRQDEAIQQLRTTDHKVNCLLELSKVQSPVPSARSWSSSQHCNNVSPPLSHHEEAAPSCGMVTPPRVRQWVFSAETPNQPHTPTPAPEEFHSPAAAKAHASDLPIHVPGLNIHDNSVASLVKEWFDGSNGWPALKDTGSQWRSSLVAGLTAEAACVSRNRIRDAMRCRRNLMLVVAPDNIRPCDAAIAYWQNRVTHEFRTLSRMQIAVKKWCAAKHKDPNMAAFGQPPGQ